MIEDKDRTKELTDAIAQGHVSYGMQTFDQSLMSLVRQNLITYQEAHRQSSNPDDFALRFQGNSARRQTRSGTTFDNKPGEERAVPGSQAYVAAARKAHRASRRPQQSVSDTRHDERPAAGDDATCCGREPYADEPRHAHDHDGLAASDFARASPSACSQAWRLAGGSRAGVGR